MNVSLEGTGGGFVESLQASAAIAMAIELDLRMRERMDVPSMILI